MDRKINKFFNKYYIKRTTILILFFCVLTAVLLSRLYNLQIINGENYANSFSLQTTKVKTLKATRGNIYDRNGQLLAYNELTYSVTLEDNGDYSSNRIKNLSLNSEIYRLMKIIEDHGDSITSSFHIILNEQGDYDFDVSGVSLERFKADIYGVADTDDLTPEQESATATDIMTYLTGSSQYMILPDGDSNSTKPYTEEELAEYDFPAQLSPEEILTITNIRYQLFTISYKKYVTVTIATDVSEDTVAAIMENQSSLQGVDVIDDYKRVYTHSEYFASLIGYTGKASTEELETLQEESDRYDTTSIIGKAGIEQYMETTLQGTDGSETVYVDNLGKVLEVDEDSTVEPQQGNDVYLTIDADLQEATYKILEQRIAGILLANLQNIKEYDVGDNTDRSVIPVAVYDCYNAIINNNMVDYNRFSRKKASSTEKSIYSTYKNNRKTILSTLRSALRGSITTPYKDLTEEYQKYESYIINTVLNSDTNILMSSAVDKTDPTYTAWTTEETISIHEYLSYAVSKDWIDVTQIAGDSEYLSEDEVLDVLIDYIIDYLKHDSGFAKLVYKYLLFNDKISPRDLCLTLYDEGVLDKEDDCYQQLLSGAMTPYDFMYSKIESLEITPAMLALDPCSGSAVVTDPNTGEFLAVVSYPGYDNNRLANSMDTEYYYDLLYDQSEPLYNKATQQKTAPGSTFKPVTAVAALDTGTISQYDELDCTGIFDKISGSPLRCWNTYGHGYLNVEDAIKESCNVFFAEAAYMMGTDGSGNFTDSKALETLQDYASMFGLDQYSGIEVTETSPQVSDSLPIPSAIGQGTHNYTTTQLARYVTAIANSGTVYDMTMIDKSTDSDGNLLEDYSAEVYSTMNISSSIWDTVHSGMRKVITNKEAFDDMGVKVAGKTGTAQESNTRPSHGLFIGYAPYDDPEVAICVRIAHGYSSTNAAMTAKDILNYYFNLEDETSLITGKATLSTVSNVQTD